MPIIHLQTARTYCAAPRKEHAQALANCAQGMMAPPLPVSFAAARASLRPVTRGRATLGYLRLLPETLPDAS